MSKVSKLIKFKVIIFIIAIFLVPSLYSSFWKTNDHNKKSSSADLKTPYILPQITHNYKVNTVIPNDEKLNSHALNETNDVTLDNDGNQTDIETNRIDIINQAELEKFINDSAIKNVPIDLVTLGRLKRYYIDANNLVDYQKFLEYLPDSYEMKNELLSDLAFLYQEHGQIDESVNLIQSLSYRDANNMRLRYYKADIYLGAGNFDVAINTLLDARQLSEEPYQYLRIAEIYKEAGDNGSASYYRERGDALSAIMHHEE